MKRKVTYFSVVALSAAILAGCLDDNVTGTRPLSFSFTTDMATAAVGEEITFRYDATATQIIGVIVDFGDGVVDSVFIGGNAVEAAGPMLHTYDAVGSYLIRAQLESRGGLANDSLTVTIN